MGQHTTTPSSEETQSGPKKRVSVRLQVVIACLLFSLGFTIVFVLLGAAAGEIGKWLFAYRQLLVRISGAVIMLLGLFVLGLVKFKALFAERRFHMRRSGWWAAPLAGMAFAFGWTPCMGPFLGSILALATAAGTSSKGALYLAVYSAGLILPFMLTAIFLTSLLGAFGWMKRHFSILTSISGGLLVVVGGLFLFGGFGPLNYLLYSKLEVPDVSMNTLRGASVGILTSFVAGLLSFLSPCVLPLVPGYLSFISGVALEDLMKSEG